MLRYIAIIMTALIVSTQPSVADININELAIKYPQCQTEYRNECFEDYLYSDGDYRFVGYFRDNAMWEGIVWQNGKLGFEYSEGVRSSKNSCSKVITWYHCPNGDKYKPLEGGYLVLNIEANENHKEGKWIYHWENGDIYEGNWKEDLQHGYGKYTWSGGSIYEGNYQNDAFHGYGTLIFSDGNIYEGNYQNNAFHGYGKYTWSDGSIYEGNWKDGAFHGYGKYTRPDGDIYEGNWKDNLQHGYGKYTRPDGSIDEGNWKDGKL